MPAGTLGRLIVVAVVAMMTAASEALCAFFLATAVSLPLMAPPALTGYAPALPTNASAVAAPEPPAPPPEA